MTSSVLSWPTLPENKELTGNIDRNWDKQFFAKFKIALEKDKLLETIAEFAGFVVENRANIPENVLMLFLLKLNDTLGIDEFHIQRTIAETEEFIKSKKNKSEIKPELETKDTSFHKSIKFIMTNYEKLYVNSLTLDIMHIKDDIHHKLDIETLKTDFNINNIKYNWQNISSYLFSKKYTSHINPIQTILEKTDYHTGDPDFIGLALSYLKFTQIDVNFDLEQFYRIMFEKWLVRCIENAIDDEAEPNKQILILKGHMHCRKTGFIRWLYDPFQDYVIEGLEINTNEIKTKKALTSNMFIFNDEIEKMSNKELQKFKIATSEKSQKYKPSQGMSERIIKRRANFVSATNQEKFLSDKAGSVRYIIFDIANTKIDPISLDLLDNKNLSLLMWGQAYYLYKSGKNYYNSDITADELLKLDKLNLRYYSYRNIEDAILNLYPESKNDTDDSVFMNATEFLEHIKGNNNFPRNLISGMKKESIGRILHKLNYEQYSDRSKGENPIRRYKFKIDNV